MISRKILGLLVFALLFSSCEKKTNVTIKGEYPSAPGEYLKLEMLNIAQTQQIDSAEISSSGKFQFSLKLDNPELLLLKNTANQYINLLVFPEDQIKIEIPEKSFGKGYEVFGSEESLKIKSLVQYVEETKFQLDSLSNTFDKLEDKKGPEANILISAYQKVIQKQKRNNIRFIVENINSLASVYALYQRISPDNYILNELKDLQYFKIVADSLSVKYPGSTLTTSLVNDVDKRLKDYNNVLTLNKLSDKNIKETGLIDLTIQNVEGTDISLSSLVGKVVLLNFWASWDNRSRETNRILKKVYDQYHSRGFEVYSISLDNDRNTWRSAIDFEEYNWINVCELSYPYSYAAKSYNISSLPANYLIDRNGTIVAKNLSGSVLATWLDNLL